LTLKTFPITAVTVIALYPDKFLWPDLLQFWGGKSNEVISQCSLILAKMDVLTDPGANMILLTDVLAQRNLLGRRLSEVDRIKLTLPRLIAILEKLAPL